MRFSMLLVMIGVLYFSGAIWIAQSVDHWFARIILCWGMFLKFCLIAIVLPGPSGKTRVFLAALAGSGYFFLCAAVFIPPTALEWRYVLATDGGSFNVLTIRLLLAAFLSLLTTIAVYLLVVTRWFRTHTPDGEVHFRFVPPTSPPMWLSRSSSCSDAAVGRERGGRFQAESRDHEA